MPPADPAVDKAQQPAVGCDVEGHDGDEGQRREDGLHHCQKDRCHRPQPLKAVQQCLPEFQRTQLMYPIDEHRSHRARTLPFASDHY